MYILGINAVFHDCAACIVKEGMLLAATKEERFTHFKHGKRPVSFSNWELPRHAIDTLSPYPIRPYS
jgi:carbamoyltransferase